MKKLRLDLDELSVETFQPAAAPSEGGTAAEFITQGANTLPLHALGLPRHRALLIGRR